jgi:hypothetical protein
MTPSGLGYQCFRESCCFYLHSSGVKQGRKTPDVIWKGMIKTVREPVGVAKTLKWTIPYFYPEDGVIRFLKNAGKNVQHNATSLMKQFS